MDLPESLDELLALTLAEATQIGASAVEPLHLFIAVCKLDDPTVEAAFSAESIDRVQLRRRLRGIAAKLAAPGGRKPDRVSQRVLDLLSFTRKLAEVFGNPVGPRWVLAALLERPDSDLRRVFEQERLPVAELRSYLAQAAISPPEPPPLPFVAPHPPTPTLDKVGRDLTALARAGKLDPVIGRHDEIKQIVRILLRKGKSNPVLVGDAGVGKTTIVEGLALRAAKEGATEDVARLRIVEVMMASIVAGTKYRGEFEERMQKLLQEAQSDDDLVLFIDEIHTVVGAGETSGGSLDAANIMKPALARGDIRVIGATTPNEYRQIEKDPALERRFQPVRVDEPTPAETRDILDGLRSSYEAHHRVVILPEALDAAVDLAVRYLPDRRLPDKARDLVDQAAVNKRFLTFEPRTAGAKPATPTITCEDIARVIAEWTGIPVERMTVDSSARLRAMDEALARRVIGQDHAVAAVCKVVRAGLTGLSRPGRPYGVFLFVGPTGVGKTELAKALAEQLFDDERCLVRIDMSELMEKHAVAKLIGAPPGYVGHDEGAVLCDAVRRTPYCVVLFDEIEKAHPEVLDLFLQIFDDGRLTDARGRVASFTNTVIIMTSNVGVTERGEKRALGFLAEGGDSAPRDVRTPLLSRFRPELVNRISQVVEFHPLEPKHLRTIIDKILRGVKERLASKQVELRVADDAYDALVRVGYKPEFGARELERVIDRQIVEPLTEGILDGRFGAGSVATVSAASEGVVVT